MNIFFEDNICNIYIDCVNSMNFGYTKCEKLMRKFLNSKKIYFTLYKDDGININAFDLSKDEIEQYIRNDCGISIKCEPYSFGYLTNCDKMWKLVPSISKWYQESIFFESSKNSEEVLEFLKNNKMMRCLDIIQSNFATIIFGFIDSGDFFVSFDINEYCIDDIKRIIKLSFNI